MQHERFHYKTLEDVRAKATELGVSQIVPVMMSRCVVRLDQKDAARKQERWQKIAREAGKQCGRCRIPEVSLPVPLRDMVNWRGSIQEFVVPWEMSVHYGPLAYIRDHPGLRHLRLQRHGPGQ